MQASSHRVTPHAAAGVATIDLNHAFTAAAPHQRVRMRLAQLSYTATQFRTVHSVHLEIAGTAVHSISGVPVPAQMRRSNFTASCGSGCRGHFGVTISYHVSNAQNGTVVVSDTSATGGRPPHITRLPVRLSP